MVSIFWPDGLPDLRGLSQGAGTDELHPATVETQMDDGPARVRRRSLFVETPLKVTLELTPTEFVVFKSFHLNDLNTGARRFSGPVLLPDLVTVAQRTCRISGKVGWSLSGLQYRVPFILLVQDW